MGAFINRLVMPKALIHIALICVVVVGSPLSQGARSNKKDKRGEVERLLRDHPENLKMVQSIGNHYYQIIYPVQLRHHEKMGISTREIGASKSQPPVAAADSPSPSGFQRSGKHFHRTSLLIKAFNHKFRLDLELNSQLLAPNLIQKHFLPGRAEHIIKQEIEHCYYHGTVRDYPGATAAVRTCSGVSGVIHVGNETFIIHPFYGGDLSRKHPHVIFEARFRMKQACGNTGKLEWNLRNYRKQKASGDEPMDYFSSGSLQMSNGLPSGRLDTHLTSDRRKRDVREVTKYIETALVLDKAMFEKRPGSTRLQVVHDAIQIANIADLYFRTLNTRVSVVYFETWLQENQAPIDKGLDISRALLNFNDYTSRKLFKVDKDTTQLLSGEHFQGDESGMAVPTTVCTPRSVGLSVDLNVFEPHLVAGTMAHMIGHNLGMGHDDGREGCHCQDWHGCIMAQSIVGQDNVQPYKFSECSLTDYIESLRIGHGICLFNRPNQVQLTDFKTCGNGIVEEGEDCDCGTIDECHQADPCCDPITCKLRVEAECASGPCCDDCRLRPRGFACRESANECDLAEYCTGLSGQCPLDHFQKNGNKCSGGDGYCFNGVCPTMNNQCDRIWGYNAQAADRQCFQQFNSKGYISGHCGTDQNGNYIKCEPENVMCGSLQCQTGHKSPIVAGMDEMFSKTIISIKGKEYECKATSGTLANSEIPDMGLVRDGTPCGDNLICINQTCVSMYPYIDPSKCPTNNDALDCSGHGVCSNVNTCYCGHGWAGMECSISSNVSGPPPAGGQYHMPGITPLPPPVPTEEVQEESLGSPYLINITKTSKKPVGQTPGTNRVMLVIGLVSVVGGVFILFAMMALCYRRSTVPKYDPPYAKKPLGKKYSKGPMNHAHGHEEGGTMEGATRIITFGSMPSYSRDHKMQRRHHGDQRGSASEEDIGQSEEECVSFIDLTPNNLSKLPEKGILKKQALFFEKDECGDALSQSDNNLETDGEGGGAEGTLSEVERTLKSLNGYHEDILEALRNAASHRGSQGLGGAAGVAALTEELRKSLSDGYPEYTSEFPLLGPGSQERLNESMQREAGDSADEDMVPPCGPIRIRNLEDLIRQLEHHSGRHMSPSGSEEIRMSETEADRHYRLDTSSATQGFHDEPTHFVYGRYRHPPLGPPLESMGSKRGGLGMFSGSRSGSPGDGGLGSGGLGGSSSQHSPAGLYPGEAIYATAGEPERGDDDGNDDDDTGDSESLATSSRRRSPAWCARPARRHFR